MAAVTSSSPLHAPITSFDTLPDDVAQCHEIVRSAEELLLAKEELLLAKETLLREKEELIHALSADLKLTKEQVDYLLRKNFVRRSEKMTLGEGQLSLFDRAEERRSER